jgi:hypothetical protein
VNICENKMTLKDERKKTMEDSELISEAAYGWGLTVHRKKEELWTFNCATPAHII